MLWRTLRFVSFLLIGGVAGSFVELEKPAMHGQLAGVVSGAMLWYFIDAFRGGQLLKSLRANDLSANIQPGGFWGEAYDRMRRLLRDRDRLLTESQQRLQDFLSALQASPNGVMLLDSDARIEWCNQTASVHFGLDIDRDVAQTIGNLVRDPGFARYLTDRDYQNSMTMHGRESNASRPVLLSVQLHPYGEGRRLLLSRDITLLEQAEAMRRDFVANVSHEIRTPLTVLAGFVETLQSLNLSDSERQQYLALMAHQAERMQTLVNDLLTLSRLEGSAPPGLETRVEIPTLMRQIEADALALSQVMGSASESDHHFDFKCLFDGNLAGTANELLSAMGNLVSNAVRYTPAGGVITVMTRREPDGGLVFSVADTGPGIAPEHIGRLTERFYRVDRSRSRETGGTGLGLAIVKHVAQRHGARLLIESTVGVGSVFSLVFPQQRVC